MKLKILSTFLLSLSLYSFAGHLKSQDDHRFYVGGIGGYGSSTWQGLVPSQENLNGAISISTPIHVEEGGRVWGGMFGYEFMPYFAVEGSYVSYPDAEVVFDQFSIFSFDNEGLRGFTTRTESLSFMGKAMFFIPKTPFRIFSSAGIATVHRQDMLLDQWRATPTFGAGLNAHLSPSLMGEIAGQYIAGFGESQLKPTSSYFPFLYSLSLRLAYFF
jgi:hypothetical protein